ncbi:MAG: Uma2 family endonuclease [Acidobacteriaceae bacterium]|nr:Uma2 family endonuclease [Acidobacteriaceae bacterium]MBV9779607.1 Uma2 family endonuclease [Acidobacteriaceae bacterium]
MNATTSALTLEEFHRIYDGVKPNHEYWFGEVVAKPVPTSLHSAVQLVLILLLRRFRWNALPEVSLKLIHDAAPVPDVIASQDKIEQPYPTKPVELCVEIRSPQDSLKRIFKKGEYYLSWGIKNVWIIDPEARTAWMMTHEHPDGIWIHPDGFLTADPDTTISLPELFEEVDNLVKPRSGESS